MMCSACLEALKSSLSASSRCPSDFRFFQEIGVYSERPAFVLLRHKKMIGNGAAPQLTEEELERVVGGYIGETEKNRN